MQRQFLDLPQENSSQGSLALYSLLGRDLCDWPATSSTILVIEVLDNTEQGSVSLRYEIFCEICFWTQVYFCRRPILFCLKGNIVPFYVEDDRDITMAVLIFQILYQCEYVETICSCPTVQHEIKWILFSGSLADNLQTAKIWLFDSENVFTILKSRDRNSNTQVRALR